MTRPTFTSQSIARFANSSKHMRSYKWSLDLLDVNNIFRVAQHLLPPFVIHSDRTTMPVPSNPRATQRSRAHESEKYHVDLRHRVQALASLAHRTRHHTFVPTTNFAQSVHNETSPLVWAWNTTTEEQARRSKWRPSIVNQKGQGPTDGGEFWPCLANMNALARTASNVKTVGNGTWLRDLVTNLRELFLKRMDEATKEVAEMAALLEESQQPSMQHSETSSGIEIESDTTPSPPPKIQVDDGPKEAKSDKGKERALEKPGDRAETPRTISLKRRDNDDSPVSSLDSRKSFVYSEAEYNEIRAWQKQDPASQVVCSPEYLRKVLKEPDADTFKTQQVHDGAERKVKVIRPSKRAERPESLVADLLTPIPLAPDPKPKYSYNVWAEMQGIKREVFPPEPPLKPPGRSSKGMSPGVSPVREDSMEDDSGVEEKEEEGRGRRRQRME